MKKINLLIYLSLALSQTIYAKCGEERWNVKTLTDSGVGKIECAVQTNKTVSQLRQVLPPTNLKEVGNDFRFPEETTAYQVKALLIGFKKEADEDLHVVIADPSDVKATMVVEIPNPHCANQSFAQDFAKARQFLGRIHKISGRFYRLKKPVPVTVCGVFFFDFLHGQTGVAPNGAELHPVTQIKYAK